MKIFRLKRTKDVHGKSGVGIVATGFEFSNGKCAMCWKTEIGTTTIFDSISLVETLHGHDGATVVEIFEPKHHGRYYKNLQEFIDGSDLEKKKDKDKEKEKKND